MNEADAYSGRVKRPGREWVCVMVVMFVCENVSVVVVVDDVDSVWEKEMRESDGCVRDKEQMLVESNEREDDELRVKREPESKYVVDAFAMVVASSGPNVVSEMLSEEFIERYMRER